MSTRTCQWPNNSGATDFDDTVEPCGIADPSFDAHVDPTVDPLPVCDKHAEKAKGAGHIITPAGEEAHYVVPARPAVDHELTVLANVAQDMDGLPDDDTRRRVATWVADRYGAPV